MVDQDAPAGKAGLKEHDVILTMNDSKVESGAQLRRMIRETPAGRIVTLGVSRDGQPLTLKVQLADRRKSAASPIRPGAYVAFPPSNFGVGGDPEALGSTCLLTASPFSS